MSLCCKVIKIFPTLNHFLPLLLKNKYFFSDMTILSQFISYFMFLFIKFNLYIYQYT